MESKFILSAAAGTHPGQVREINQDNVLACVRPSTLGTAMGLLIVADGMGGHKAGEVASRLAVDTIHTQLGWMLEQDDAAVTLVANNGHNGLLSTEHLERRLQVAFNDANRAIYDYARHNPVEAGNLGCTATCAVVYGNTAIIANVGDSRTYRLNNGQLTQITDDHSYVGQLIRQGYLSEDDIFEHPQRNVITRALGSRPDVRVDLWSCTLDLGDRLLLCSDGMWEMIRDRQEIATRLRAEPLETAVTQLIEAANHYGGQDNIGVVVAELSANPDSPINSKPGGNN